MPSPRLTPAARADAGRAPRVPARRRPRSWRVERVGERSFRVSGPRHRAPGGPLRPRQRGRAGLPGAAPARHRGDRRAQSQGFEAGDDVEIAGVAFDLDPELRLAPRVGSALTLRRERWRMRSLSRGCGCWRWSAGCRSCRSRERRRSCGSGPTTASRGSTRSIQAAVNAAKPGDWILVGPGDYKTTSQQRAQRPTNHPAGVLITNAEPAPAGDEPQHASSSTGPSRGAPRCSSQEADQNFGPDDGSERARWA